MEFKEYTEYPNPESRDYDLKTSYEEENDYQKNEEQDKIYEELTYLIGGILEDEEFDNVEELYGITQKEYLNPTKETIKKVKEYLGINPKSR